jgi:hypothetical protein
VELRSAEGTRSSLERSPLHHRIEADDVSAAAAFLLAENARETWGSGRRLAAVDKGALGAGPWATTRSSRARSAAPTCPGSEGKQRAVQAERPCLERGKEALREGVVEGIAASAHAGEDARGLDRVAKARLAYWPPRLDWWTSPGRGRRRVSAVPSASRASSVRRSSHIDQPTISGFRRRARRREDVALPGGDETSATHRRSGPVARKSRRTKSAAAGASRSGRSSSAPCARARRRRSRARA